MLLWTALAKENCNSSCTAQAVIFIMYYYQVLVVFTVSRHFLGIRCYISQPSEVEMEDFDRVQKPTSRDPYKESNVLKHLCNFSSFRIGISDI